MLFWLPTRAVIMTRCLDLQAQCNPLKNGATWGRNGSMCLSVLQLILILVVLFDAATLTSTEPDASFDPHNADADVKIFHLIDQKLFGETDGSVLEGTFTCPRTSSASRKTRAGGAKQRSGREGGGGCEVISTDVGMSGADLMSNLAYKYRHKYPSGSDSAGVAIKNRDNTVTVGLYSIHSWGAGSAWPHHPDTCRLPTLLNMAESEESTTRFHKLFNAAFPGYDGNSTTSTTATVQRFYVQEFPQAQALLPVVAHKDKLVGAAYVASTCHGTGGQGQGINNARRGAGREVIVSQLEGRYRIDSLGSCHRTARTTRNPGQVELGRGGTAEESDLLKQRALSKYLFYFAFENTVEAGYVTEKVFDALKAGTVPVYLGHSESCKKVLPHPKAAIFLDDFIDLSGGGADKHPHHKAKATSSSALEDPSYEAGLLALAAHLKYLSRNETAYNEHLSWRDNFDSTKALESLQPELKVPWPCRVCEWARDFYANRARRDAASERMRKEERSRSESCAKK